MRMLLIADGIPPRILGGSGRIAWDTATGLARGGHAVTMMTAGKPGEFPAETQGVRIACLPPAPQRWAHYRSVFSRSRAAEVIAVIDRVRPELIHAHTVAWQSGYRWIPEARRRGIPVVFTAHDAMNVACGRVRGDEPMLWLHDLRRCGPTWNPLRSVMIRRLLGQTNRMLCVSDALRTYMERHGFRGLRTLHNGIDVGFWSAGPSRADARRSLGLPADAPLFLLAGRIGYDKGSSLVTDELPKDARLVLAGEAHVPDFAAVSDRLHYFPRQDERQMRVLYAACDLVLVPSICLDCFPTVCIEGMAAGRAVLGSTFGGARESVRDGETGWIVNPLDGKAFAERLAWCAAHRGDLDAFGNRGRRRAAELFSIETYLQNLLMIYAECR